MLKGRIIYSGKAEGRVLKSKQSISFYGGVDSNGKVIERGHDLEGKYISGKILVFPSGKGSTVGTYTIYSLKIKGKAPKAMIIKEAETIIASGAILSEIPTLDKVKISKIKTNDKIKIDGNRIWKI